MSWVFVLGTTKNKLKSFSRMMFSYSVCCLLVEYVSIILVVLYDSWGIIGKQFNLWEFFF